MYKFLKRSLHWVSGKHQHRFQSLESLKNEIGPEACVVFISGLCANNPSPTVLHLLLARILRFILSELPGGCPGVGPIIYCHKYQVVS